MSRQSQKIPFARRIKKVGKSLTTALGELYDISEADKIPLDDVRMLRNITGNLETQVSALGGTFGRMRSIPSPIKQELIGYFGIEA